jgi:hypothetical protein
MVKFDLKEPTGVDFETIMSLQQLATQMFQQDMATGAPQGAVQEPQATAPAGGNQ